jgi:hypothetical protein
MTAGAPAGSAKRNRRDKPPTSRTSARSATPFAYLVVTEVSASPSPRGISWRVRARHSSPPHALWFSFTSPLSPSVDGRSLCPALRACSMRSVLEAFAWGLLAASSLLLGAVVALRFKVGLRPIGLIMAFGAGVLISALAFDLIEEAVHKATGHGAVLIGVFVGCGVFFGGDWVIDRAGGERRKAPAGVRQMTRSSPLSWALSSTAYPNRW